MAQIVFIGAAVFKLNDMLQARVAKRRMRQAKKKVKSLVQAKTLMQLNRVYTPTEADFAQRQPLHLREMRRIARGGCSPVVADILGGGAGGGGGLDGRTVGGVGGSDGSDAAAASKDADAEGPGSVQARSAAAGSASRPCSSCRRCRSDRRASCPLSPLRPSSRRALRRWRQLHPARRLPLAP
eukprot:7388799-Prymnesium_polylepis.1